MTSCSLSTSSKLSLNKCQWLHFEEPQKIQIPQNILILKYYSVLESYNCARLASNYKWKVFFLRSVNVFTTEMNFCLLSTVSMLVCKLLTLMQR